MYKNKINQKGFTLIEIIVVITVIGVLSSFIMTSISKSRAKGRDLQRMTDLKQLQVALRSYYLDKGFYPSTGSVPGTGGANGISCFTCVGYPSTPITNGKDLVLKNPYSGADLGTLTAALAPYIKQLIDPQENNSQWSALPFRAFLYSSNGYIYKITINRTPEDLRSYPIDMLDPARCGGIDSSTGICNAPGTAGSMVQSVSLWSDPAATAW